MAETRSLSLGEYLEKKKVSELQEFLSFWGNGGRIPDRKADLRAALQKLMRDEETVFRKLHVLSKAPMQLLHVLIRSEDYRADIQSVFYNDHGIQLEYYEVEAAARALSRRGFLEISRSRDWIHYGKEVYTIPREMGDTVNLLLAEEHRGPKEVFTLRGHLSGMSRQKLRGLVHRLGFPEEGTPSLERAARFLTAEKGARDLLEAVSNRKLREMFGRLIREYGGVISRARYEKEVGAPVKWDRKRWQRFLEGNALGTMSNISLDAYGLKLEGESVVLFKEIVEAWFADSRPDEEAFDRVLSARIDLLTDLVHFLRYVGRTPVKVTQGKTLYKSAHGRILAGMVFRDDAPVGREEVLALIWDLVKSLELVEVGEDRVLRLTPAGEAWEGEDLVSQVERIYERFLEESSPDGRDFHLRELRKRVGKRLRAVGGNGWHPFMGIPFTVRNDYLADLDEEGIRERYRNRFQFTYDPPRMTLPGLARDLADWLLRRLFVLGVIDVALVGDEPAAVRLTELGQKVLGMQPGDNGGSGLPPLVVNPDFEVLVFPEGEVIELVHTLDRFAIRTRSEEVSRYRILKEGVERAVVKGMPAEEILRFLTAHSRTPIPQNVEYSIRDWGETIRFGTQREVVLLRVDSEEVMDRVLALEPVRRLLVERLGPETAALKERISDWRTLEELRRLGVYMKG